MKPSNSPASLSKLRRQLDWLKPEKKLGSEPIHPRTFRFLDPETEEGFLRWQFSERNLGQIRWAIFLGTALYFSFLIVDFYVLPSFSSFSVSFLIGIRIVIFCLGSYILVLTTREDSHSKLAHMLAIGFFSAGIGIVVMMSAGALIVDEAGVLLVLLYALLLRVRRIFVLIYGGGLTTITVIFLISSLPGTEWVYSVVSLLTAYILCAFASGSLEKNARANFANTQDLKKAAESLKKANREKSELFTNITHDLRSPLQHLLTPIDKAVKTGDLSVFEPYLPAMQTEAWHLQILVTQLLEATRIEAGMMPVEARCTPLAEYLEQVVQPFKPHLDERGITLSIDAPDNVVNALVDPHHLFQIAWNLIDNAMKHTEDGGAIALSVEELASSTNAHREGGVQFSVRDNGSGISEEDLPHIFERYYWARRKRSPNPAPLKIHGLGLSIVHSLVELNDGAIRVDSKPGFGATFSVRLPRAIPETTAVPFVEEENRNHLNGLSPYLRCPIKRKRQTPSPPLKEHDSGLETVLVVDDEEDMRFLVSQELQGSFNVLCASSGQEALQIARKSLPSIIVTDEMMPGMGGTELCRRIRDDEMINHIPVIFVTAKADSSCYDGTALAGAVGFVPKPFDPDFLKLQINNLLRLSAMQAQFTYSPLGDLPIRDSQIPWISRVEELVRDFVLNESCDEKLRNAQIRAHLSNHLGIGEAQISKKVKAITRVSLTNYLNRVKIGLIWDIVERRLDINVNEVADRIAIDAKRLGRLIKERFGMTAREYLNYVRSSLAQQQREFQH